MKLSTYKCDGCGVLRSNDSNNWWRGKLIGLAVVLSPFPHELEWPSAVKTNKPEVHLCGVQCASKWASEQMNIILERLGGENGK